jgi:hypothetical protein
MKLTVFAVLLLASCHAAAATAAEAKVTANPIRKVVMMLQNMQIKIAAEGEEKKKLYDKYMCYCKNADETLAKSIADAEEEIPQLEASIKEELAEKKQLKADIEQAKVDRDEAKEALGKATALREKEAKAYKKFAGDSEQNIAALDKAIPAIEQGMEGNFLQTQTGTVAMLKKLSVTSNMNNADRELLASFLDNSQDSEYAPRSGEIVGILKQMKEEMEHELADAKEAEAESVANYEALAAAKKKEIEACTKAIEVKTARYGEVSVAIAETENELEDKKEGLEEDKKFLADLDKNCDTKKVEWEAYKKLQAEEQLALADTIKVLNDDDALELFKKTLPSASSFMQLQVTNKMMRARALDHLKAANSKDPRIDLVQIALRGGKNGFAKIIKMIDELVVVMGKEQQADDDKKNYCDAEFDKAEDKAKELKLDIGDTEKAIDDNEETIAHLEKEIEALTEGIKELDKAVAEATEMRKEEHDDYVKIMAADASAKEILAFAKNRLNKFYNPKLYKPPPKRVLSEEDQIVVNMGGTLAPTAAPGGIAGTGIALSQVAPPPPPEANLAFKKSNEENNGVIAMIDILVADLDKEMQEMEVEEKHAQEEYEKFIKDSADKRALDSKAITDMEAALAETKSDLEKNKETHKSLTTELMQTDKYIASLHQECDWLLKYYDARKAARAGEVDSLGKAKDVLNGADYSLVQMHRSVHLRGVRRA